MSNSSSEENELDTAFENFSLGEQGETEDIFQRSAIREQTPPQKTSGKVSEGSKSARTRLFPSDPATAGPSTSSQRDEDQKGGSLAKGGCWMMKHPWEGILPKSKESMNACIGVSKVYTLSNEWLEGNDKVNMEKICSNLPKFIYEMKGKSCREALQSLLNEEDDSVFPHIKEIIQEKKEANDEQKADKPSRRTGEKKEEERYKAFSSPQNSEAAKPDEQNYLYLDCEYMLHMYLPESFINWFEIKEEKKQISAAKTNNKRWIFIPSYRRADIALMDWPKDEIITQNSTIRILVVRPYEFEKYVKNHGHSFPVISLPQEEIGAGYARFWIQKIALRLELPFIWMIDDSVECFYEYHPKNKPKSSYNKERRLKFGFVFKRIEEQVKEGKGNIAAMSPKRFIGGTPLQEPFASLPPRIAVFLNLNLLKKHEVYYRPELQVFEDMVFGYECERKGLKVFINNRIHLYDHDWKNTGARSASIKQKHS